MNTFAPLDRRFGAAAIRQVDAPIDGVSVVSVAYRTGPTLFEHIDSVLDEPMVGELVLVDNGSTAEDSARLRQRARAEPRMVLVQGHGNVGFASACNLGADRSRGRTLLFLNPDALLQPGVIPAMLDGLVQAPRRPAIVGARLTNPDGSEQRGGRRGDVSPVSTFLSLSKLARLKSLSAYEIHREHEPAPERCIELPTISGACFMMRREDYWGVGGFDTGYFLHVEDIDLCWRVRKAGGVVLYQPHANVLHYGHTSLIEPVLVEFWKGRGLARYFRKRADSLGGKSVAWVLGPMIVGACLVRAVLIKLKG